MTSHTEASQAPAVMTEEARLVITVLPMTPGILVKLEATGAFASVAIGNHFLSDVNDVPMATTPENFWWAITESVSRMLKREV